ncbi:MAG: ABC transporter ATP-binding protein [Acidimicrobiales bacterium]
MGLEVEDLHKSFGANPVLTGLTLSVPEGSLAAILGASGSGKTTLLRVLAGFERADRGRVSIGGRLADDDRHHLAPEERHLGYVPQEGALFPHLSAARNVAFGVPRSRRGPRVVEDLLEMVGMGGMGRRYPHQLSGGQQQRVALARALAVGPRLVLLDEPFSSLDPALRASVRADVAAILRRASTTALLVTHDQDEALSWADLVAVIDGGRIGQVGTPQSVYAQPGDLDLARFLGETNVVGGVAEEAGVRTGLGLLAADWAAGTVPAGAATVVLVRPEQLELVSEETGALAGEVTAYEYFGHDAVVRVRPDAPCGPGEPSLVVRVIGPTLLRPGDRVGLTARGPVRAWPGGETAR